VNSLSSSFKKGLVLTLAALFLLLSPWNTAAIEAELPEGTVEIAKFNCIDGQYVFERPAGNQGMVVIGPGADGDGGSFTASVPIAAVVVAGGGGFSCKTYSPPVTSGTFDNNGLPEEGSAPDIEYVIFARPLNDHAPPVWPAGSSLTASDTGSTCTTLEWTEATDDTGVTKYRIYKDDVLLTVAGTINSYEVTGLSSSTSLNFRLRPVTAAEIGPKDPPLR
jgi:hypothetical protein